MVQHNRWEKYNRSDLARIDKALYGMYQLLSETRALAFDHNRCMISNFHPHIYTRRPEIIEDLAALASGLSSTVTKLTHLQYTKYHSYVDNLRSVVDNSILSETSQAVSLMKQVVEELPSNVGPGLMRLAQQERDKYDAAMNKLGAWIADRQNQVKQLRAELAETSRASAPSPQSPVAPGP
jgi:hypothetical protein